MKPKFREMVEQTYAELLKREADKGNSRVIEHLRGDSDGFTRQEMRNLRTRKKYKAFFQNNRIPCYFCGRRYDAEYLDKTFEEGKEVDMCIGCQRERVKTGTREE